MIVKVTVLEGHYSDFYVDCDSEIDGMDIIRDAYLNKEIAVGDEWFYDFETRRMPDGGDYVIFNEVEDEEGI